MILLDTHTWVWWVDNPNKLSKKAIKAIEKEDTLGVSIFSCWELAMLVEKGRIAFRLDIEEWILKALHFSKIKLVDLSPKILILSTRLPGQFHPDPADRILVATAKTLGISLITKDDKILKYPHIQSIW